MSNVFLDSTTQRNHFLSRIRKSTGGDVRKADFLTATEEDAPGKPQATAILEKPFLGYMFKGRPLDCYGRFADEPMAGNHSGDWLFKRAGRTIKTSSGVMLLWGRKTDGSEIL